MGRGRLVSRGRADAGREFVAPSRSASVLPPPSPVRFRRPDPSVLRRVREVDPHLDVVWDPEGVWWTPASAPPPGVSERGAWAIELIGRSGARRRQRMWHPNCCDGRLVDYLEAWWGQYMFALRSTTTWGELRRERIRRAREERDRLGRETFDAWWNEVDHDEMHRAVRQAHFDPKWRGGWQVHADTPAPGGS